MNILIVASKFPPEYSGPGVRIPRLYDDIKDDIGAENISVICNGIEYTDNETYTHKGMKVQRVVASSIRKNRFPFSLLPARIHNALAYFRENILTLRELEKRKNIDLVHIIGFSGGTAAAIWWARKNNIPVLLELVTAKASPKQKFIFFREASLANAYKIIALTDKMKNKCIGLGVPEDRIWLRPNPIETNLYKNERSRKNEYRGRLSPFTEDDIVISSVAKIIPQKNQILLVKTMKYLPENYKLLLAGPAVSNGNLLERDRNYIQDIIAQIEDNGLQERVHLVLDFVQSAEYMKASDIYAMPAWDEGFGTPMLEAMSCGLPVVANKCETAFKEWIVDGRNGFLCDIKDEKEWADALQTAAGFSETQRFEISEDIGVRASQKRIHSDYIGVIRELSKD